MSAFALPARRAAHRQRNRADALRLLADGGCPVCLRVADSDRHWVTAFVLETNADPDVVADIRAARGFCAVHLRLFLNRTDAAFMLPASLAAVTAARIGDLASGGGPLPGHDCPICRSGRRAAGDTVSSLAGVADDPEVQKALGNEARACLPHTIALLHAVPASARAAVLAAFAERFADTSGLEALELLAGDDADATARGRLLPTLAEADEAADRIRQPALQQAIGAADQESCGVCRAKAAGAVRYLRWLEDCRRNDRGLEALETALCPAHLRDLASLNAVAASWVAEQQQAVVAARLGRLAGGFATLPQRRGIRSPGRESPADLAWWNATTRTCPACKAAGVAERRRLALLAAAMPDPLFRRHLGEGHGPCVVHAPALARAASDPLPTEVLRARLQVLAWELEESRRKREWWVRHEHQGREMGAWRYAPTWLGGDAYLGLGAVEGR